MESKRVFFVAQLSSKPPLVVLYDEKLPSYVGIIAIVWIPINQPGFHGMSAKGFERCSSVHKEMVRWFRLDWGYMKI